MTIAKQGLVNPVGEELITLTQTYPGAGVARGAEVVASGSKTVYAIEIDNTANTATTYLKGYVTAPTIGSTNPTLILMAAGSTKVQYSFDVGFTMAEIHAATLTTNGFRGNTGPEASVTVKFLLS